MCVLIEDVVFGLSLSYVRSSIFCACVCGGHTMLRSKMIQYQISGKEKYLEQSHLYRPSRCWNMKPARKDIYPPPFYILSYFLSFNFRVIMWCAFLITESSFIFIPFLIDVLHLQAMKIHLSNTSPAANLLHSLSHLLAHL